jgi:REP-associated tyrosine transposase
LPRRPRLSIAGIPWHIIHRGNNRESCFFAEDDYRYYLAVLKEQAHQYQCVIHVYALMPNHVHILLTPEKTDSASMMMKHVSQRYVQYINKKYHRSGTLWEGRFRSCLTQEEKYVIACYRYIELNPVRAGLVKDPSDYPWSSFRANALGETNALITPHKLYEGLGQNLEERQAAYRDLFRTPVNDETINEIRQATNGNFALGDEKFKEQIESLLDRRARPGRTGRPRKEEGNKYVKAI